jgi:hypothetical protein
MEHGMERSCYSIEKHQDHWVVTAHGARILICKHKKAAIMLARRASNMLHDSYAIKPSTDYEQPAPDASGYGAGGKVDSC